MTYGGSITIPFTGKTPLCLNLRGSYQRTRRDYTNLLICPSLWVRESALEMIFQRLSKDW
uniref:Uncharacterized protein n=1 Tax=Arcella intermedia TaxID=1963864 RepID=A0A6B2LWX2_9EUKA